MYLNCHSYYSFKYGMISPEQLLMEAKRLGIYELALTDINNTSGILDFFRLAPKYNIKPIAGIDFRNGTKQQFVALAKSIDGFKEMNDFLSSYLLQDKKERPEFAPEFNDVFIIYPFSNVPERLRQNEYIGIRSTDLNRLPFSPARHQYRKHVVLQPVTFFEEETRMIGGKKTKFHPHHVYEIHRLLRAMDGNTIITKISEKELALPHEIMLPESDLKRIFADHHFAIKNAEKIVEECFIDFEFGKNKNKKTFYGTAAEDRKKLVDLCAEGMKYRYPDANEKIKNRYKKEINMITTLGFTGYFLINWDIVRFARSKNYFYVGRGSGANSMVAYLLNITDVDPIDLDLYFERFINTSRKNPPDFDIDFSSTERDYIIKYIFETHGIEHTALLATYSTLQENAVIRELGKVYGLPGKEIDALPSLESDIKSVSDTTVQKILAYGNYLKDFPSHLSIHAGGILISDEPIHKYTATVLPPKNFSLTQFSMLEAEDVGLYKFDILAQRGLGKIKDAVEVVKQNTGKEIDIHDIKRFKEDEGVREKLQAADLMGCFYVESPAMRMLLAKLKASTYLDLVAASSIIRPGVAQSGMMREYIVRFHHPEKRVYPSKLMEELLHETFGVMVYQEDVIKVAHYFAGLSLDEADKLRRGMGGKYRGREEFAQVRDSFFSHCRERQIEENLIKEVWRQMESFGGYAFAKGHSASFAVESYQCMFLKTYYPLEYMVAVLNNGGGFYGTEFYVHEARMKGAVIHAPDVNLSDNLTVIYGKDIYLGLSLMKDLEKNVVANIVAERNQNGLFNSLADFLERVPVAVEQLKLLVRIGAFRFTGRTKMQLMWDIHIFLGNKRKTEPEKELFGVNRKKYKLPELEHGQFEDALDEREILDFSLCSPFKLLKEKPEIKLTAAQLPDFKGKVVSIVGQLVTRKITHTKKGDTMSFGTFLDTEGRFIDTTHFPDSLKQYPFSGKGCYVIKGKVVEEFGFYSIEVNEMQRLDYITRFDEQEEIESINS